MIKETNSKSYKNYKERRYTCYNQTAENNGEQRVPIANNGDYIKKEVTTMKKLITLILAVVMIMGVVPTTQVYAEGYPPIQANPEALQSPEGYSLKYIGRYSTVTAISDGMLAVSSGDRVKVVDKPFFGGDGIAYLDYWGFVNAETGKEVVAPKYLKVPTREGVHLRYFDDRVVLHDINLGYLVLDKEGKVVVQPGKYEDITDFTNGMAIVRDKDWNIGVIDKTGKELITPGDAISRWSYLIGPASQNIGIIPVSKSDKDMGRADLNYVVNGLMDVNGNMVVPFKPEWEYTMLGEGKIFAYRRTSDNKKVDLRVIDTTGKKLFDIDSDTYPKRFSEGLTAFTQYGETDRVGVMDNLGNKLFTLPTEYWHIDDFSGGGYVRVKSGDGMMSDYVHHVVDKSGKIVLSAEQKYPLEYFLAPHNGLVAKYLESVPINEHFKGPKFVIKLFEVYNLKTGKMIIPEGYYASLGGTTTSGRDSFYKDGGDFPEGMVAVFTSELLDERDKLTGNFVRDNVVGFLDMDGNEVVPLGKYKRLNFYSEGKCEAFDGENWGYIDKKGEWVIEPQFHQVTPFVEGKAVVGIYAGHAPSSRLGDEVLLFDWYILSDNSYKPPVTPTSGTAKATDTTNNAKPTRSKVLVNGTAIEFDAYNINNNNYFKLRDLAQAVTNTEKNFEVTWDGKNNAINLISNKPYTAVGGELVKGDGKAKAATLSTAKIYKDGKEVTLTAYTINGNNYFKLRDIAKAFDIGVTWDSNINTVGIDTSISYVEE